MVLFIFIFDFCRFTRKVESTGIYGSTRPVICQFAFCSVFFGAHTSTPANIANRSDTAVHNCTHNARTLALANSTTRYTRAVGIVVRIGRLRVAPLSQP